MKRVWSMCLSVVVLMGCAHFGGNNNAGQMESYPAPTIEAAWIRNGEPIVYDGKSWYPAKDVETFMDAEVYQIGEYKNVQIFVDKVDIKPYSRIYTKFAKNKYRYFERVKND